MSLNQGGDANDWFFLAMTRWRQNDKAEARKWFDQAVAWTKNKKPDDFRDKSALVAELEELRNDIADRVDEMPKHATFLARYADAQAANPSTLHNAEARL